MDDGWFKQTHLAPSQTDWTLGLGEAALLLLSNQCAQVKPAITTHTHTHSGRPPEWQHGAPTPCIIMVNGKRSSFILRFYAKRFTVLSDIHPLMHSCTQSHTEGAAPVSSPANLPVSILETGSLGCRLDWRGCRWTWHCLL